MSDTDMRVQHTPRGTSTALRVRTGGRRLPAIKQAALDAINDVLISNGFSKLSWEQVAAIAAGHPAVTSHATQSISAALFCVYLEYLVGAGNTRLGLLRMPSDKSLVRRRAVGGHAVNSAGVPVSLCAQRSISNSRASLPPPRPSTQTRRCQREVCHDCVTARCHNPAEGCVPTPGSALPSHDQALQTSPASPTSASLVESRTCVVSCDETLVLDDATSPGMDDKILAQTLDTIALGNAPSTDIQVNPFGDAIVNGEEQHEAVNGVLSTDSACGSGFTEPTICTPSVHEPSFDSPNATLRSFNSASPFNTGRGDLERLASFSTPRGQRFYEHCPPDWDFSIYDMDLPFQDDGFNADSDVTSGTAAMAELTSAPAWDNFWGEAGKPICDISDRVFEDSEFAPEAITRSSPVMNPLDLNESAPTCGPLEGDCNEPQSAHFTQQHRLYDFARHSNTDVSVPAVLISLPDFEMTFASVADEHPTYVPGDQDEGWGSWLAVPRPGISPINTTAGYFPVPSADGLGMEFAPFVFEHGEWKNARLDADPELAHLCSGVPAWYVWDVKLSNWRRVRPRDIGERPPWIGQTS